MKGTVVKLATVGMVAILAAGSMAFVTGTKEEGKKEAQTERFDGDGCRGMKECGGDGEDRMLSRLDLTAEQKTRIEEIRSTFRTENATTLTLIKSLHTRMREARANNDEGQMKALHQEMRAAKESLRPASQQMNKQIRALLTPEQIASLGRRGHGRGGCRGGDRDQQPQTTSPGAPSTVVPGLK